MHVKEESTGSNRTGLHEEQSTLGNICVCWRLQFLVRVLSKSAQIHLYLGDAEAVVLLDYLSNYAIAKVP